MREILVNVECPQCMTEFKHDANFEDAWCPQCGGLIEVSGEYQDYLMENHRVK